MSIEIEVFVRDDAGLRYRVYDVAFGPPLAAPGRRRRLALGDPRARYRVFVPGDAEAMIRVYDFKRDSLGRAMTDDVIAAQFRRAAFASAKPRMPAPEPPGTKLGQ